MPCPASSATIAAIECGESATLLADFGADVIKIEPPGAGDAFRMVPKLPGMPQSEHPYGWLLDNRNKRGLALDLAKSEGQAALHRLVSDADVFITNYPLVVRKKLAIDHERLEALNERLIYASFTGYGETGAEAGKPGFDVTAYWARSGLMDMVRSDASTPPARALAGMGDHPSGVSLFAAIAVALYQRERTGRGTMVGSSLLANGIWSNGIMAQATLCGATFTPRPPREKLFNALGCYYRCRDGRWLLLAIVNEQRDWPVIAKCLGLSDLIDDPRFTKQAGRFARSAELIARFDAAFAKRDRDEWRVLLDQAGIVFECVAEMDDLSTDRQMLDAGVLVPFENDAMLTIDSPLIVAGTEKGTPGFTAKIERKMALRTVQNADIVLADCRVREANRLQKARGFRDTAEVVGWERELLGGNGIVLDYNVGRFVADAEAIYSYEGTREMNTLVTGRAITGFSAFV